MTIIATDGNRFSTVVKQEYSPATRFCRDAITYNGTAATLQVGAVLGAYIASPTITAGAMVGTGNATVGTASVTANQFLQLGTYTVSMITATTFAVLDPAGDSIGMGATTVPFKVNGLVFTVTAGATPAVAGDTIPVVIDGTVKYKLVEATATDGTQNAKVVYIADNLGLSHPTTPVVNTDTKLLVLSRGPAVVNKSALSFGASVDTAAELALAYSQLAAVGILTETQV